MSKKESNIIKAIAIVLMVVHHFWGFSNIWLNNNMFISIEKTFGFPFESLIGAYSKICVGLFAYITGCALYIQKTKFRLFYYRLNKCLKFLLCYWIIYLVELLICIIIQEPLPNLLIILENLFGIGSKVFEYGTGYFTVCFAWYVYFYLLLLLSFPLISHKWMNNNLLNTIIPIFVVIMIRFIISVYMQEVSVIRSIISDYLEYLPVVLVAYNLEKNKVYDSIIKYLNTKKLYLSLIVLSFSFALSFIVKIKIPKILSVNIDLVCVPLLIFVIKLLIKMGKEIKLSSNIVNKLINMISIESMNIWFLHSLFFTPYRKLQPIALFPQVSLLIIPWVFIILIPISLLFSKIQKKVILIVDFFFPPPTLCSRTQTEKPHNKSGKAG